VLLRTTNGLMSVVKSDKSDALGIMYEQIHGSTKGEKLTD